MIVIDSSERAAHTFKLLCGYELVLRGVNAAEGSAV